MCTLRCFRFTNFTLACVIVSAMFIEDSSAATRRRKSLKNAMPLVDTTIGPFPYETLNFTRGNYKKTSGPENCIEGEYRMLRDPKTGRVYLRTEKGVLVDHLDQRVKNHGERDCIMSYFNTINKDLELESTEVQSCSEPISVSNIRTLKIKFEPNLIKYILTAKDPLKKTSKETKCELERQN